ncbi:MAG: hypothetical protein IH944_03095 [Armatimonadetes bacterium]|nr:hypothetical protein [Armatimonadota bacterium]
MKTRVILVALALSLPTAAFAGWTALVLMPIADILGHREAYYGYSVSGTEPNVSKGIGHSHGMELGVFDRLELGYDNDFDGSTVFNTKLLLFEEPEEAKYAISIGVADWSDAAGSAVLLGRHDFDGFRLHVAVMAEGSNRLAVGIDAPFLDIGTWTVEYASGPGAYAWGGLFLPIDSVPGLELDLFLGVPSNKSDGVQYSVGFVYGWTF